MKYWEVGAHLWEHRGNTPPAPERESCWAKLETIACGLPNVAPGGRMLGLVVQVNGVIRSLLGFKTRYSGD